MHSERLREAVDHRDESPKDRRPQPLDSPDHRDESLKGRRPGRRRRVPSPDKGPGRKSYWRKGREAELAEQKRLPSSDKQRNRAAADEREESLRGGLPQPLDSHPSDENEPLLSCTRRD
jgi:hypothetical protein